MPPPARSTPAASRPRTTAPRLQRAQVRARRASVPGRGEEDRCAEAIGVLRAEPFDVVLACDIHTTWSELRIGKGRVHEVAALDSDHPSRGAVADEVDGDVRER